MRVDFATFCHKGDAERLHKYGQLEMQVDSNDFSFNNVIVVYQMCNPADYEPPSIERQAIIIDNLDDVLRRFNINLDGQYVSDTDRAHHWKYHVVNHLAAVEVSQSDYLVFADNDCWMIRQPDSWISFGIDLMSIYPEIFLISPNDGENERSTRRMSQQMFMVRTDEFRQADFNQPDWDGNTDIPGGPMPEYWGMLEGRIELYCRKSKQYRYVLPAEYRYWHFNRINSETNHFEMELDKY